MSLPVVIAGGGLAGAAAGCLLARAGWHAVVLERERHPGEKMCGEFVSTEAIAALENLGVPAGRMGPPIGAVRLVRRGRVAEARLPFRGIGLSRRVLDAALMERAAALGAELRRGVAASSVDGSAVGLAGGGTIAARSVLLATGKHDLRGARRRLLVPAEDLVGFKMYFRLHPAQAAALAGHVEVILFRDSYAGLQMTEGGRANLCLLAARDRLRRNGDTWPGLLADLLRADPHLARRLDGAQPLLDRPLSIYRVPYGHMHVPVPKDVEGMFRLGDQAAVIPSFTGDGMAIALHSARLAVAHVMGGLPAAAYHRRLRRDVAGQIARASALYRFGRSAPGQAALMGLAEAWPGALQILARLTRVPPAALSRAANAWEMSG